MIILLPHLAPNIPFSYNVHTRFRYNIGVVFAESGCFSFTLPTNIHKGFGFRHNIRVVFAEPGLLLILFGETSIAVGTEECAVWRIGMAFSFSLFQARESIASTLPPSTPFSRPWPTSIKTPTSHPRLSSRTTENSSPTE